MAIIHSQTASANQDGNGSPSQLTFADQAIGDADADRYVVVGITGFQGIGRVVTSATIGGISATLLTFQSTPYLNGPTVFVGAAVPTGTTATIVINFDDQIRGVQIFVHRIVGANHTLVDGEQSGSGNPASTSASVTLDIPADGLALYVHSHSDTPATSWSSATGITDATRFAAVLGNYRVASASKTTVSEILGHTETASWSGGQRNAIAGVSFAPAAPSFNPAIARRRLLMR